MYVIYKYKIVKGEKTIIFGYPAFHTESLAAQRLIYTEYLDCWLWKGAYFHSRVFMNTN